MGQQHEDEIRAAAEATTRSGKLTYIGQYQVGPLRYLRVNFTTGDAAGQNMTAKATLAACEWIQANYPGGAEFRLTGAIDTDKKHSHINMLMTRGKRVVAEAVIGSDLLQQLMGVDTQTVFDYRQIQMAGGFLAGRRPTARTLPTASPRCSSPPVRTPPTSPSRTPRSRTRGCSTTATTTGRSRCPA